MHLSQERYWKVDGIIPAGFDAKSAIVYNGTNVLPATSYNGGYLDPQLITNVEDSLVLMYRTGVGADWQIEPDVVFNYTGVHTDKKGIITINHLKKGEYALAIYQHDKQDSLIIPPGDSCLTIVSAPIVSSEEKFSVYPNPSQNTFFVSGYISDDGRIDIFNLLGVKIYSRSLQKGNVSIAIDTRSFGKGIFIMKISEGGHQVFMQKQAVLGN